MEEVETTLRKIRLNHKLKLWMIGSFVNVAPETLTRKDKEHMEVSYNDLHIWLSEILLYLLDNKLVDKIDLEHNLKTKHVPTLREKLIGVYLTHKGLNIDVEATPRTPDEVKWKLHDNIDYPIIYEVDFNGKESQLVELVSAGSEYTNNLNHKALTTIVEKFNQRQL